MKTTKNPKGITIVTGIVLALLVALTGTGLALYNYVNVARNELVAYEAQLTAQYLANQNYLSAYTSGFYEKLGVTKLQSEKLNQILLDAVKGRYDKGGFKIGSSFFTVIREAYPEQSLAGLMKSFDKVSDYVSAGREGYRATQDKFLDQLRAYERYRETDLVRSWVVANVLGAPTERLEARIGEKVYRGKEAREKMYTIVLTSDTRKAYETGTMEPLQVK